MRWGPKPSQFWWFIRAPCARAMSQVPSVLPQSITSFSAATGTLSRQRAMVRASLKVITTRVRGRVGMGGGDGMRAGSIELFNDRRNDAQRLLQLVHVGPVQHAQQA